ncbi:hypothetical protein ANACAC_00949 [Anaerostipes caccae L1-92]|uniref:Uncharacterized protein n=1 Tax=Anaerostipes caccae (strain DSM 14662 / CCUG 47493 / JCM 13470 / NCIMB 13811 / L1-92) TaxID=411490 RepID=B0MC05_ANACD|nr:hypothetical protein ANACAC_00949 [Anaerostipes caccae L1-92]
MIISCQSFQNLYTRHSFYNLIITYQMMKSNGNHFCLTAAEHIGIIFCENMLKFMYLG